MVQILVMVFELELYIASQSPATYYQIVSHKNLNKFNRKRFLTKNL